MGNTEREASLKEPRFYFGQIKFEIPTDIHLKMSVRQMDYRHGAQNGGLDRSYKFRNSQTYINMCVHIVFKPMRQTRISRNVELERLNLG